MSQKLIQAQVSNLQMALEAEEIAKDNTAINQDVVRGEVSLR